MRQKDSREHLAVIQDELDQILAEIVQNRREHYLTPARGPDAAVDVFETDSHIHVRFDLPGVELGDLALSIARDVLYLEAQKRSPYVLDKHPRFCNLEREFGRLKREIIIPKPIDARHILARLDNGVLLVSMPKISDRRGEPKPVTVE